MGLYVWAKSDADVEEVERLCREKFEEICKGNRIKLGFDRFWTSPALDFDSVVVQCARDSARSIGCEWSWP